MGGRHCERCRAGRFNCIDFLVSAPRSASAKRGFGSEGGDEECIVNMDIEVDHKPSEEVPKIAWLDRGCFMYIHYAPQQEAIWLWCRLNDKIPPYRSHRQIRRSGFLCIKSEPSFRNVQKYGKHAPFFQSILCSNRVSGQCGQKNNNHFVAEFEAVSVAEWLRRVT